jgi:hypothetical protein
MAATPSLRFSATRVVGVEIVGIGFNRNYSEAYGGIPAGRGSEVVKPEDHRASLC